MASTNVENRVQFTLDGQSYSLNDLVQDITLDTGTIAKQVQSMTSDRSSNILLTNFAATLTWTEVETPASIYVQLINTLSVLPGVDFIAQEYTVGTSEPDGVATLLPGCVLSNQNKNFASQDTEGKRKITIIATNYQELT